MQGAFSMASKKDDDGYTLKLTGPGITFDRTVAEDVATKIITFVMGGADLADRSGSAGNGGDTKIDKSSGGQLTPKQFVSQKKPGNNYERVACLAYYLANYRDMPHFKTSDITKLNTESAGHFFEPCALCGPCDHLVPLFSGGWRWQKTDHCTGRGCRGGVTRSRRSHSRNC